MLSDCSNVAFRLFGRRSGGIKVAHCEGGQLFLEVLETSFFFFFFYFSFFSGLKQNDSFIATK